MAEDSGAVGVDKLAPGTHAKAITEHDTTAIDPTPRALYIGGAGDLYIDTLGGEKDVPFIGVTAGSIIPVRATRLKTASTVSSVVAIW